MSKKIGLVSIAVLLLLSLGSVAAKPAPPAPEIERGVFIDYGHYSSPWWYPDECDDTRTSYQWAPKLHWTSDDLPVDCTVYTLGAPAGAFDAVTPAFAEWDGHTSATIYGTVQEDDTTPPGVVQDEENTMSWGEIDGPGGVIGVCYYWYWVNTKQLVEFDIVFDKDEIWLATDDPEVLPALSDPENPYPNTGQFDVWNIATHELGHTLVLGDLRSPKDGALTMHAYTWTGDDMKRILGWGDVLGIQAIYGD